MVQPPQPADAEHGHPEPDPAPAPDPGPPQPIPVPDPIPTPEPPHTVDEPAASLPASPLSGFAAPAPSVPATFPPPAAFDAPPAAKNPAAFDAPQASGAPAAASGPTSSIAQSESADFIDAGPVAEPVAWPPVGAYPGEPGHQDETAFQDQLGHLDPPAAPERPSYAEQLAHLEQSTPTEIFKPEQHAPTELIEPVQSQQTAMFAAQPAADQAHEPAPWQPQEPWHAQHERPGEWHTQPPEHLAWEHSPPPETLPTPPPPWQVPPAAAGSPRKRRAGLWVSLALTVTLLLCGGGAISAYFLISNADTGKGAPDPGTATNQFLIAVYTQQDPTAANDLVCRESRDRDKLVKRVAEIKQYASQYDGATFHWNEPAISGETKDRAVATVQLSMSTDDEKTADQTLTLTLTHKTSWLVCDISG